MKIAMKSKGLTDIRRSAISYFDEAIFFRLPLSDFEILTFQKLLMTPSLHFIKTDNVETGRLLMDSFLSTLKHYYTIGCLTAVKNDTLPDYVFDVFKGKKVDESLMDSIEIFCIENPLINFFWIELTESLALHLSDRQMRKAYDLFSSGQASVLVIQYKEPLC